jgi:hypothetical protein
MRSKERLRKASLEDSAAPMPVWVCTNKH